MVQTGNGALNVRVLLNAVDASKYDLIFGIDGVAATLDIKVRCNFAIILCDRLLNSTLLATLVYEI